jgi:hypothetical protein
MGPTVRNVRVSSCPSCECLELRFWLAHVRGEEAGLGRVSQYFLNRRWDSLEGTEGRGLVLSVCVRWIEPLVHLDLSASSLIQSCAL